MRAGTISYLDLQAQLETQLASELKGRNAPSLEIIRQWERNQPDFPERAVRDGLVPPARLPGWAQNQLRLNLPNVELHSLRLGSGQSADHAQSSSSDWGPWIVLGIALLLGNAAQARPAQPEPTPLDFYRGSFGRGRVDSFPPLD